MRALSLAVALLLASASAYAGEEPTDHPTQTEKAPPAAPQTLVFVTCQVDDLTGTRPPPGTPGAEVMPAPGWRDLELRVVDGEYQCKRTQVDVEDAVAMNYARKPYKIAGVGDIFPHEDHPQAPVTGSLYAEPLSPNFGDHGQCARAGIMMSTAWNENNPGHVVVAVGCPTPLMSDNGTPETTVDDYIVGWILPSCPTYLPGTDNRMFCRFDESAI